MSNNLKHVQTELTEMAVADQFVDVSMLLFHRIAWSAIVNRHNIYQKLAHPLAIF